MISEIEDFEDGGTLSADVVVIGSGIAGSDIAMHLSRKGVDVLLLESGRTGFDPAIQALNEVHFSAKPHRRIDPDAPYHPYLPPELRGVSRVRQFGGTSAVWTGKWKHLQPSDLVGRPWVRDSAWPIAFAELLECYRETAADYGFGDLEPRPSGARFARCAALWTRAGSRSPASTGRPSRRAPRGGLATRCAGPRGCASCWARRRSNWGSGRTGGGSRR